MNTCTNHNHTVSIYRGTIEKTNWSPLFVHEWLLNNFRCYSSIGRDSGPQNLVLGSSCYYEGVILHEMNHAVGFFHEQSRYDRDDYIFVNWENVQDGILFQDIAFI